MPSCKWFRRFECSYGLHILCQETEENLSAAGTRDEGTANLRNGDDCLLVSTTPAAQNATALNISSYVIINLLFILNLLF
jgi:hypothetical protein